MFNQVSIIHVCSVRRLTLPSQFCRTAFLVSQEICWIVRSTHRQSDSPKIWGKCFFINSGTVETSLDLASTTKKLNSIGASWAMPLIAASMVLTPSNAVQKPRPWSSDYTDNKLRHVLTFTQRCVWISLMFLPIIHAGSLSYQAEVRLPCQR